MDIRIKTTKLELTDDLKEYVGEKMNMLGKYLGGVSVSNCDVELEHALNKKTSGKIYRAEVNLSLPGTVLRVEKMEPTINKAIDKVKDHLVLSIKKYKEKKTDKKRGK
jgi:ribosomal subunit interface protein